MVLTELEETAPKRKLCIACKQEFSGDEITCPNDGTTLTHLTMEASIGSTIGEKYEILAVIGGGAMGLVYKARHTLMKRVVAVKMLHPNMLPDAGTVMRFKKEAEALSCLNHPNILTVFDFGISTQGQPYLVTDYLEGQTLGELLEASERVPWDRTVRIFLQVCSALAHAHKNGVIHRDIKPSNIMLTEFEDQPDFVKILDFGIAKVITEETENSSQLTRTGEVFGSPLYMSPEQCRGKSLDARSDIYSLGCVMFRTLTGQPAFFGQDLVECLYKHVNEAAPSLREMTPEAEIPEELEAIVLKSLMKNPDERYQTMVELKEALANSIGVSAITSTSIEALVKPSGQTMVNSVIQEMSSGALPKAPDVSATGGSALEITNPDSMPPLPVLQEPGQVREPITGATLDDTVKSKSGLLQDKRALIAGAVLVLLAVGVPVFTNLSKNEKNEKNEPAVTDPTAAANMANPVTFRDKLEKGIDEYELGDYDEAQDVISEAIRQGKKENVAADQIAEALHYMVNASIGAGDDTEAEAFVSQLEHDAKVNPNGGPPTTMAQAKAYLDHAAVLMTHNNDKDDDKAKSLLTEALKFFTAQESAGNEVMRAQSRLGLLALSNGDFASAEDWMKKAVSLAESDPNVRQLDLALRMDQLGDAYVLLAGSTKGGSKYYAEAQEMYFRAMQLRYTSVKSKTHPALAQSHQRIGIMYYLKDDYAKALTELETALDIRKAQNKPLQIAAVERNIAYVYLAQRNFAKADQTFHQAIATAKQSPVDTSMKIKEWQRGYDGLKARIKRHR